MTPEEMYEIEAKVIEIGLTFEAADWLRTLPNCKEIVAEVLSNSGKYGDTLLISCELINYNL